MARRGARPSSAFKEASASGSITLLATKNTPFDATMAGLRFFSSETGGDGEAAARGLGKDRGQGGRCQEQARALEQGATRQG